MVRKIAKNNAYIDLLLHDTVYHTAINFPTMFPLFGIAEMAIFIFCFSMIHEHLLVCDKEAIEV